MNEIRTQKKHKKRMIDIIADGERTSIEVTMAKVNKKLTKLNEFAENIIDTVHEPLLALDQYLRVVKASRSFYNYFKVNAEETIGTLIYDLGNH